MGFGVWFLGFANMRTHKEAEIKTKLLILKKHLPLLASVPYTRLVFLSGSVATGTARPESDIDLIVVSKKNRLWLNRFCLEIIAWLLGHRRTKNKFKNRFCFNMFLADDQPLLPHQDTVAAGCYKNLKPIWSADREQLKNFWQANNWLEKYYSIGDDNFRLLFTNTSRWAESTKLIFEKILDWSGIGFLLEKIFFKLQYIYLKHRFNAAGGYQNPQADFFVKPNLIAYHFPVSHHNRELQKAYPLSLHPRQ